MNMDRAFIEEFKGVTFAAGEWYIPQKYRNQLKSLMTFWNSDTRYDAASQRRNSLRALRDNFSFVEDWAAEAYREMEAFISDNNRMVEAMNGRGTVPALVSYFISWQYTGDDMPFKVNATGEWRKSIKLNDIESTKLREWTRQHLLRAQTDGLSTANQNGETRYIPTDFVTKMLEGEAPIPAKYLQYVCRNNYTILVRQMKEYRTADAMKHLEEALRLEDWGVVDVCIYPLLRMSTVVRHNDVPVTVSARCSVQNSAGFNWRNVIVQFEGIPSSLDSSARERARRILAENYLRAVVEDSFGRYMDLSEEFINQANSLLQTSVNDETKLLLETALKLYRAARVPVLAATHGIRSSSLGGGNFTEAHLAVPQLAKSLKKVMPVLREKRGAYYEAMVKEVEQSARAAGAFSLDV